MASRLHDTDVLTIVEGEAFLYRLEGRLPPKSIRRSRYWRPAAVRMEHKRLNKPENATEARPNQSVVF